MDNFEGSVEAPAGGGQQSVEATASSGGGADVGVGLEQPSPTFISSPFDVALTAATIASGLAATTLALGAAPSAPAVAAVVGFAALANAQSVMAVIQDSAVSADFAMDRPGAFSADSEPSASVGGVGFSAEQQAVPVLAWDQINPSAAGGGGGGG